MASLIAWDDSRVLRLADTDRDDAEMIDEFERIDLVAHAGAPVPGVHGIDAAQGRIGIIEDRVDGPSMLVVLSARPWQARRLGRELGELHRRILRLDPPAALPATGRRSATGASGPSVCSSRRKVHS